TAGAVPGRELVRSDREGQVNRDADDLRRRVGRRRSLKEVFIPVAHFPLWRRRSRDARQGESRRQDMLSDACVRVLRIERVHEKRITPFDRGGGPPTVETRRSVHFIRQPETPGPLPERLLTRDHSRRHEWFPEAAGSRGRAPKRRWRVRNSATASARSLTRKSGHMPGRKMSSA